MKYLYMAILLFISPLSYAAEVYCEGVPSEMYTQMTVGDWFSIKLENSSGEVYGPWVICRVDEMVSNISADRCKSAQAQVMSAMMASKKIQIAFIANSGYASCGDVPAWNAATSGNIKYIRLKSN